MTTRNGKMVKRAKTTLKMGRGELKVHLSRMRTFASALLLLLFAFLFLSVFAVEADTFAIPRAEFAKYYRRITGKDAPDGAVRFAIDPAISKSGNDAYRIVSSCELRVVGSKASSPQCATHEAQPSTAKVAIIGLNLRSVLPSASAATCKIKERGFTDS